MRFEVEAARRARLQGALIADDSTPVAAAFQADVDLTMPEQGGRHSPVPSGHFADAHMSGERLRVRVALGEGERIAPGTARANVRFELGAAVPIEVGAPFALADGSDGLRHLWGGPARGSGLIGGGVVTTLG
jgi:translation elongation factor EF-Tu-like GTPase